MARKKSVEVEEELTVEAGTVEFEAQRLFEREKAAYEERTGETVNYVPPTPLKNTPMASQESEVESLEQEPDQTETEGE